MKTLISDLGGVLLYFSHTQMCEQVATVCGLSSERVKSILFEEVDPTLGNQSLSYQLECGNLSNEQLHAHLSAIANRPIDFHTLLHAACDIFRVNEEMISLLEGFKKRGTRLVLLSNTSEAHFTFIRRQFSFLTLFDSFILSYEIKACKPEEKIYLAAIEAAQYPKEDCLYIDDVSEYVTTAELLGIPSYIFKGTNQFLSYLKNLKIK